MFSSLFVRPAGLALIALCLAGPASVSAINLLPGDTSFETGTGNLLGNSYRGGVAATWNTTTGAVGQRSLNLEWKHGDSATGPDILLKKGPHTLSFYARSDQPVTLTPLLFRSNWTRTVSFPPVQVTSEWQRFSATQTLDAGFHFLAFRLNEVGVVGLDGVQLVAGTEAGDFQSASPVNLTIQLTDANQHVFFPEEEVPVVVAAHGTRKELSVDGALDFEVTDWKGVVVFKKRALVQPPEADEALLAQSHGTLKDLAPGLYTVDATLSVGARRWTQAATFAVVNHPAVIDPGLEPFAGINCTAVRPGIRRIGARWIGDPIRWSKLEPSEGEYRWGGLDGYLARKTDDERVILDITEVPIWACDPAEIEESKRLGQQSRYGLLPAPDKLGAWRAFIRNLAERYGRAVDVWEIGREDDLVWQKHPYYSRKPEGSDARRAEMIRIAAEEIRAAVPGARVGGVRPSGVDSIDARPKFAYTRSIYERTDGALNILPLDPYTGSRLFDPKRRLHVLPPEAYLVDGYKAARAMMTDLGLKPSFYASEIGYAVEKDEPLRGDSARLLASYLARVFLLNRATDGFQFTRWYVADAPIENERYDYGIWRDTYPTLSVPAFATVAGIVENTRRHALVKISADVWATVFDKGSSATAALWHTTHQTPLRLTLPPDARLSDLMGAPVSIPQQDGDASFSLTATESPLYLHLAGDDAYGLLKQALETARDVGFPVEIKVAAGVIDRWQIQLRNKLKEDLTLSLEAQCGSGRLATEVRLRTNETRVVPLSIPNGGTSQGVLAVQCRAGDDYEPYSQEFPFSFTPVSRSRVAPPQICLNQQEFVRPIDPYLPWGGETDLAADIRLSWDDTYLHVMATVLDDVHHNRSSETQLWTGDSLQIGIDARGEDGLRAEPAQFGPHDYEVIAALNRDRAISFQSAGRAGLLDAPDAVAVTRDAATNSTSYHVKIPWEGLGVKPAAGVVLGFNVAVFDNDGGRVDHWVQWSDGLTGGAKNYSLFHKIVLSR